MSKAVDTTSGSASLWAGFLILLALACLMTALGASPTQAQQRAVAQGDICTEMLALLGAQPSVEANTDAARCDAPINVQTLLTGSPVRAAREAAPVVCVPPDSDVTLNRVAEIFYGFGSQYLDTLYENPYVLLIEALEAEFPCQSELGSAQPAS